MPAARRAGLNIVTTADRTAGRNFGLPQPLPHRQRYERAAEFAEVVKALWDSWEDDALVGDKDNARFIDTGKVHPIHHVGHYFSVEGALNGPRPPQGRPVVVQAGGSDDGKDFAARHADAFSGSPTRCPMPETMRAFEGEGTSSSGRSPTMS